MHIYFMDFVFAVLILFFLYLFRWGFRLLFVLSLSNSFKRKTGDYLKKKFEGDDPNA